MTDNVKVAVRIRPFSQREIAEGSRTCVWVSETDNKMIEMDGTPKTRQFAFDWTAGARCSQQEVFNYLGRPMIDACVSGYNGTVFAYGQTGAGKTYTMLGREEEEASISDHRGLQPRCIEYLFWRFDQIKAQNSNSCDFLVKCTYVEIYNEQFVDLLSTSSGVSLHVREDIKRGVYLEGATEETTGSLRETLDLLKRGARNRHIGATSMNIESSRSHSVLSLFVESKTCQGGLWKVRRSQFHFVDLAGSERQKKTEARGERLKEGCNINKSLSVLGSVINSLVESTNGKKVHIRYRDSKLTFLLRDSLGGNSKTAIIANISPASSAYHETLSTLQFAQRAKLIKNKARLNEDAGGDAEALRMEVRRLKEELEGARSIIQSLEDLQQPQNLAILAEDSSKGMSTTRKEAFASENGRYIELESMFRETVTTLYDVQSYLECEINKREDFMNQVTSVLETQERKEQNMRLVVKLSESRADRQRSLASLLKDLKNIDPSTCATPNAFVELQSLLDLTHAEKEAYKEISQSSEITAKVYGENILLRSRLYKLESLGSPAPTHPATLGLLQRVMQNLADSLADRQNFARLLAPNEVNIQEIEELKSERANFVESLRSLENRLRQSEEDKKILQRENDDLKRRAKMRAEAEHKLDQEFKINRDLQNMIAEVSKVGPSHLEGSQTKISAKTSPILVAPQGETCLMPNQDESSVLITERLRRLEKENASLQDKLESSKALAEEEKNAVERERSEVSKLVRVEADLSKKIAELQTQLSKLKGESSVIQKEKNDLNRQYQLLLLENDKLKRKTYQQDQETIFHVGADDILGGKSYAVDPQLEAEITTLRAELLQSEEDRDTLARSLDFFKEDFDCQKKKKDKEIKELKQALQDATAGRSYSTQNELTVSSELSTQLQHQIRDLKQDLEGVVTEKEELSSQLKTSKTHISELSDSILSLQKSLASKNSTLDDVQSEYERVSMELTEVNSLYSDASAQITRLNASLSSSQSTATNLTASLSSAQSQVQALQEKERALMEEHVTMAVRLERAENDASDSKAVEKGLTDKLDESRSKLNRSTRERNKLMVYSNTLFNSLLDMGKQVDDTSTVENIYSDIVNVNNVKNQNAILNACIEAKDKKLSQGHQDAQEVIKEFKQCESQLKKDIESLEVEYSKLASLAKLRISRDKKLSSSTNGASLYGSGLFGSTISLFGMTSTTSNKEGASKDSLGGTSDIDKLLKPSSEVFEQAKGVVQELVTFASGVACQARSTGGKSLFKENINASNMTTPNSGQSSAAQNIVTSVGVKSQSGELLKLNETEIGSLTGLVSLYLQDDSLRKDLMSLLSKRQGISDAQNVKGNKQNEEAKQESMQVNPSEVRAMLLHTLAASADHSIFAQPSGGSYLGKRTPHTFSASNLGGQPLDADLPSEVKQKLRWIGELNLKNDLPTSLIDSDSQRIAIEHQDTSKPPSPLKRLKS